MTISPWAMLITPITPKVMAKPMAASSRTEPSDRPYQAFCTGGPDRELALDGLRSRLAAAPRNRRRLVSAQPGQQRQGLPDRPVSLMVAMASSFFSIGGVLLETTGSPPRALGKSQLRALVSLLRKPPRRPPASMGLIMRLEKPICAAWISLGGIGRQQTSKPPQCGLDGAAQAIVQTAPAAALSGILSIEAPVAASMILAVGLA